MEFSRSDNRLKVSTTVIQEEQYEIESLLNEKESLEARLVVINELIMQAKGVGIIAEPIKTAASDTEVSLK